MARKQTWMDPVSLVCHQKGRICMKISTTTVDWKKTAVFLLMLLDLVVQWAVFSRPHLFAGLDLNPKGQALVRLLILAACCVLLGGLMYYSEKHVYQFKSPFYLAAVILFAILLCACSAPSGKPDKRSLAAQIQTLSRLEGQEELMKCRMEESR